MIPGLIFDVGSESSIVACAAMESGTSFAAGGNAQWIQAFPAFCPLSVIVQLPRERLVLLKVSCHDASSLKIWLGLPGLCPGLISYCAFGTRSGIAK